jgi:hypothetical protein
MTEIKETKTYVLKALYEKWWLDHRGDEKKYPSLYGSWENIEGKRERIPDEHFAELANRLTEATFCDFADSLSKDGLIDLFDMGLDAYYVVTEKGLAYLAELQRAHSSPVMPLGA